MPFSDDIDGNVISWRPLEIRKYPQPLWLLICKYARFFAQFAQQRLFKTLISLNPSTGKVPTAHVAVSDEQNSPLLINNNSLYPQRLAPG